MLNVVKIGGNVIDSPEALSHFLELFAQLDGPKILVHGGGKEATRLSASMGVRTVMIEGRRVTDRPTLDIVTMVYAGLINKRIVASLQAVGCDAVGLTGADGNSIPAARRPSDPVDYGFVGDIDARKINSGFIASLINDGLAPVFCAICHDSEGSLLNCNADSVAAALAIGMAQKMPVRLIYCFEKPGVLADVDDVTSVIPLVTPAIFEDLLNEGKIYKGMLPKLKNALDAAEAGVCEIRICQAQDLLVRTGTFIRCR